MSFRASLGVTVLVASLLAAAPCRAQCVADTDCKGSRKCLGGQCVEAPVAPGSPALPPPPPTLPPAALPPTGPGGLHVTASSPATVHIDGQEKGKTPLELSGLTPGEYHVRVEFEVGGETRRRLHVHPGETTRAFFEPSRARQVAQHRRGATFGFEVAYDSLLAVESGHVPAGRLGFATNVGLGAGVDFRTGVELRLGGRIHWKGGGPIFVGGVPVMFQFNLGSVFTLALGGEGSFLYNSDFPVGELTLHEGSASKTVTVRRPVMGFLAGPRASIMTFRMGSKRSAELGVVGGFLFPVALSQNVKQAEFSFAHASLQFTYLFL